MIEVRDSTRFKAPLHNDHREPGRVRLLTVGRAYPGKGLEMPVAALALRPDLACSLTVIGDGPELARVRQLAAGDERVSILGAIPSASILDHFASADAFVFPSRIDIFGLVVVEAFGAGLPTILSRSVGSADDLAVDEHNCVIVDGTDPSDWAAAIELVVNEGVFGDGLVLPPPQRSLAAGRSITRPAHSYLDSGWPS